MLEKFAQRVKAGAKLLDERMPDWRDKIDVRRLDMHEANDCILGQIGAALPVPDHRFYTPPYLTAGRHFGILGQQMLIDLGFETDLDDEVGVIEQYELLRELWEQELQTVGV